MQVVMMCGGKGTRLRPYTAVLPKPLVPVGETSILEIVLRQLRSQGFERVTVSVGHKAELIMAVIGDGKRLGLDLRYHREYDPLGTVGALAEIPGLEENFLVLNGDVCTTLNFSKVCVHHEQSGALATIATCRRDEKLDLGVMDLENGRVVGFREKPVYSFHVSTGINVYRRDILAYIPKGRPFGFDELMRALVSDRADVRPYLFDGFWLDIGCPEDYSRMVDLFASNPEFLFSAGS
jgi:NDP-mannose synthase